MKVTFSRPPTAQVPAVSPPVATSVPRPAIPASSPRRPSSSTTLVVAAALLVVVLAIAVVLLWSLLMEGSCPGLVGGETITMRAPGRGRVATVHATVGERVRVGDRLVTLTMPDDADELVRLRERRADESALLTRLEAGSRPAATTAVSVPPRETPPAIMPVSRPADSTHNAEIAALTAESQAAVADATAREETRTRMELLVRLDAALPEDAASATREARLARTRADTLAARLAGLQAADADTPRAVVPTTLPSQVETPVSRTEPASAEDRLQAVRARIAALDASIARLAVRTVTATAAGTVLELPTPGGDVAADGMLAVLATGRLWLDVHLPADRGELAARTRTARVRGFARELPLTATTWRQQAVPAALQFRMHATTTLGQRLDLPPDAPFMPGEVVEVTLR